MAYSLFAQNGKPVYGVKNYVLDSSNDISNLPIADTIGSTAYVINEGKTYILNNNREWVASSSSSGGGTTTTPEDEYEAIPFSEIDSYFED